MNFTIVGTVIICCTAFLTGIAKTGIQGLGIVLVPLVAMAMPVRMSTGFLLPLMCAADLAAVIYWRKHVSWPSLRRVIPWTVIGIVGGYFIMKVLSESVFKPVLGGLIVAFVVLDLIRRRVGFKINDDNKIFLCVVGVLAGSCTMIANAGGPIMTIYLLTMALPKEEYVGTTAVFFWMINLIKIPFSVALGLITWASLKVDLMLIPLVAIGCLAGFLSVKKLPQKIFDVIAQVLATLGGIKLFF